MYSEVNCLYPHNVFAMVMEIKTMFFKKLNMRSVVKIGHKVEIKLLTLL